MQVEVHDVDPHIPRTGDSHQGIEVGTVTVDQAATLVHQLADLFDIGLEQSKRVWVGDHQCSDIVIHVCLNLFQCEHTLGSNRHDIITRQSCGCRIGTMGRIRDQHLAALAATSLVPGTNYQHAGEFALGAGCRLQGHARKTGDFSECKLQVIHQLKNALRQVRRSCRVNI